MTSENQAIYNKGWDDARNFIFSLKKKIDEAVGRQKNNSVSYRDGFMTGLVHELQMLSSEYKAPEVTHED